MDMFTYTVGRSEVVHAATEGDRAHAHMLCGAESHRGPRRYVSAAAGRDVTCKTCIRKSVTTPVAPVAHSEPLGPLTAFAEVMRQTLAANARVFG